MSGPFDYIVYHLSYLGILLLLTQSLHWIWRIGLFSLGHNAFYAAGAYTAIVTYRLVILPGQPSASTLGPGAWLLFLAFSVLLGAVVAGGLGALVFVALRDVRSDYFAVGTLVFGEALLAILGQWNYVGGPQGFDITTPISAPGERLAYLLVFLVGTLLANICSYWLFAKANKSMAGIFLLAARDDEMAARTCGIPIFWLQFASFVAGTSIAGAAGVLLLHFTTFVHVNDFTFANSLPIIAYVVLGAGAPGRCIVAATVLDLCYQVLMLPIFGVAGGRMAQIVVDWRTTLYGLVLIAAATFALRRSRPGAKSVIRFTP